jgi:hypothetical protein
MSSGPFGAELKSGEDLLNGLNSSPKMRSRGLLAGNYQRHDVMMYRDTELLDVSPEAIPLEGSRRREA